MTLTEKINKLNKDASALCEGMIKTETQMDWTNIDLQILTGSRVRIKDSDVYEFLINAFKNSNLFSPDQITKTFISQQDELVDLALRFAMDSSKSSIDFVSVKHNPPFVDDKIGFEIIFDLDKYSSSKQPEKTVSDSIPTDEVFCKIELTREEYSELWKCVKTGESLFGKNKIELYNSIYDKLK